jgi:hypothetical protein
VFAAVGLQIQKLYLFQYVSNKQAIGMDLVVIEGLIPNVVAS